MSSSTSSIFQDESAADSLPTAFCGVEEADIDIDMDMDSFDCSIHQHFAEFVSSDQLYFDSTPQSFSFADADDSRKVFLPLDSSNKKKEPFKILNKYATRCRRLNGENTNFPSYEGELSLAPSVEAIIQLGAEKFIKSSCQLTDELSVLSHPYPSSILCRSKQDSEGVRLVQHLLSCAEKVHRKKYEEAFEDLLECDRMSSSRASPIQRLVFYFAEALYEKIDRETGQITPKGLGKKFEDPLMAIKSPDETEIVFHNELPVSQITKFAGIQAVVDNIGEEARKLHFINFDIRKGIHCIVLMQALVDRGGIPLEHLKISAIGVGEKSREGIEATGRRLMSSAQSLGLPFSFHVAMVEDVLELDEKHFVLDPDEVIAVYAEYTLTYMIVQPEKLEHLMKVMRGVNVRVMVVGEVEANCNSPIFVDRFVEALFFYGAYFESMAVCVKNEKERFLAEETCFASSIRNVVATEGKERKIRHVRISVWRSFFTRFGFEETELSMSSVYQANLVVKNFGCGSFFTFNIDGKSLIIGWKGTPMSSISAWRFS